MLPEQVASVLEPFPASFRGPTEAMPGTNTAFFHCNQEIAQLLTHPAQDGAERVLRTVHGGLHLLAWPRRCAEERGSHSLSHRAAGQDVSVPCQDHHAVEDRPEVGGPALDEDVVHQVARGPKDHRVQIVAWPKHRRGAEAAPQVPGRAHQGGGPAVVRGIREAAEDEAHQQGEEEDGQGQIAQDKGDLHLQHLHRNSLPSASLAEARVTIVVKVAQSRNLEEAGANHHGGGVAPVPTAQLVAVVQVGLLMVRGHALCQQVGQSEQGCRANQLPEYLLLLELQGGQLQVPAQVGRPLVLQEGGAIACEPQDAQQGPEPGHSLHFLLSLRPEPFGF
mmetsp:Transcript_45287/g.107618  ORF Transcript_45287/g.107618 Transcript_45287/m.107618 type:complete len:335 (+) Transcript_45287:381-1385(+)